MIEAAVTRRFDRMTRQNERLERDITIGNAAFALFVRAWRTATPPLPDAAQAAAQAEGANAMRGLWRFWAVG